MKQMFSLCLVALIASMMPSSSLAQSTPPMMFAYAGGPSFLSGVFREATSGIPVIQLRNPAGQVTQRLSGSNMISNVVRFNSFQCVDQNTYYAHYSGVSYPTNTTVNICNLVRYLNATMVAVANTDLNVNQTCPGINELPTLDSIYNTTASGQVASRAIYTLIPTALPITPPNCVNVSSTITFKKPLVPSALPAASSNASCGPYPNAGGSPVGLGIWSILTPPGSNTAYVAIEAMNNTGAVLATSPDPTEASGLTGVYLTSQCLGDASSKAVSFLVRQTIGGTVSTDFSCSAKSVVGQTLQVTSALNITVPAAPVAPIPDSNSGVCVNSPPTPSPEPSPPSDSKTCTYRGLWKIRPKASACQGAYLAYNPATCTANNKCDVILASAADIKKQNLATTFGLNINAVPQNVAATSEDNIVVFMGQNQANLAAKSIPGGSLVMPVLQSDDFKFKVVPVSQNSCVDANLIYESSKYLTVDLDGKKECKKDVMKWTDKNSGYAQFVLEKASELGR